MALINCPECGKEISDKSDKCIHCGYPLKKNTIINNKEYNLSYELELVLNGKNIEAIKSIREKTGLGLADGKYIADYMNNHKQCPDVLNFKQEKANVLRCPKCGSTQITTGARGVNHFWGFIGASKTVDRCGNCGHTWTPRG